jgi:glutamyl-tRNA synthetase
MADEPIVFQSERIEEHKRLLRVLLDEGKAYKCYCATREMAPTEYYKYDGRCRAGAQNVSDDTPYVVRIKLPLDQPTISFDDAIRGTVTFSIDELDDFVIARSDGTPVYNFVVVVDDNHMDITHVIRGEDHISNTPKQIVLYNALGFDIPQFAHLPLILGSSGQRLSKRDAATSVFEYKEGGYLPEALCNYLVRLGWAYGDQELFTRDEMIKLFTLDGVGKKGSMFDIEKLKWFNSVYMREYSAEKLLEIMCADVAPTLRDDLASWSSEKIIEFIDLYKDRVSTLQELSEKLYFIYSGSYSLSEEDVEKWLSTESLQYVRDVHHKLSELDAFDVDSVTQCIKTFCGDSGIKLPVVAQPLRLALTGSTQSPGVFQLLSLFGKQQSLQRIEVLLERA